jgi:uncharacterized protein (UPF0548 family)
LCYIFSKVIENTRIMVTLRLPNTTQVADFLSKEAALDYTYAPQSGTRHDHPIKGYDNDYQRVMIGRGDTAWADAKAKIRAWQMFPAEWTIIMPIGAPIQEGQNVAMYAKAFGLWWRNSCRVVYTIDEPDRFGFAYGTLPGHIERGEELFLLERDADGGVWYAIKAFSKPRHLLAKLGYPAMRYFQARFRRDSAAAMRGDMI